MANRLETAVWDEAEQKPVGALEGLSHVRVTRQGQFFTDTMLEAHRINSPYLLESRDKSFMEKLKNDLGELGEGPIDRRKLASTLLKYDACSLIHGVFLAKKELAGGRLRVARALSAFIEADGIQIAASGGVKNDHVNPQGNTKDGFGNVPFARDEYTARAMTLFVNIDLALLRGYGLGDGPTRMLILLALYKLARLLDGGLRLRTACDLVLVNDGGIAADRPSGFTLPTLSALETDLKAAISTNRARMEVTTVEFNDVLKKGKDDDDAADSED
jgi:CRISPR-associated protein Csb1